MNRARLPPTFASRTQRRFTVKHQMQPLLQIPGLASQALLVIDQLASVIDDACVLVNGLESEYAPAVDFRAAAHDLRKFRFTWHPQRG